MIYWERTTEFILISTLISWLNPTKCIQMKFEGISKWKSKEFRQYNQIIQSNQMKWKEGKGDNFVVNISMTTIPLYSAFKKDWDVKRLKILQVHLVLDWNQHPLQPAKLQPQPPQIVDRWWTPWKFIRSSLATSTSTLSSVSAPVTQTKQPRIKNYISSITWWSFSQLMNPSRANKY